MLTLGQALGCDEGEAQRRFILREALENYGSHWADDFDRLASICEDQAAQCPLHDQPRFAFLRGQATAYRRLASEIRSMPASNAAIINQLREANQGD